MKCNNCNLCFKEDMAHIPFIEHERRMFKAYERIKAWKIRFIVSNIVWVICVIWLAMR